MEGTEMPEEGPGHSTSVPGVRWDPALSESEWELTRAISILFTSARSPHTPGRALFPPADADSIEDRHKTEPAENTRPIPRIPAPVRDETDTDSELMRLATKRERLGRSVWQANRKALEAPDWFGYPGPKEDSDLNEDELPLHYGIRVDEDRALPPGGDAGKRFGKKRGNASVLAFPLSPETVAKAELKTATMRSTVRERVLPFRKVNTRPAIVLFSLSGGVGRTTLAAGLTRILASCGEQVMLTDSGDYSLLPRYFGGEGSRKGVVRKFSPRPGSGSAAVRMLSLDVEPFSRSDDEQDRVLFEFNLQSANADRVVWDLGSGPIEWIARVLRQDVRVIVPLLPTAQCLMQLPATESILKRSQKHGEPCQWRYVLNQFDERNPSHMAMRSRFLSELGEYLLPFCLRSTPLVNEALLSGKTILDHAPGCPLSADWWKLARSIGGLPQAYPEIVPGAWGEC